MPAYEVNPEYGPAISVEAGDVVENNGFAAVRVSASDTPSDDDAATIPAGRQYRVETSGTVRFRSVGRSSRVVVARGL